MGAGTAGSTRAAIVPRAHTEATLLVTPRVATPAGVIPVDIAAAVVVTRVAEDMAAVAAATNPICSSPAICGMPPCARSCTYRSVEASSACTYQTRLELRRGWTETLINTPLSICIEVVRGNTGLDPTRHSHYDQPK